MSDVARVGIGNSFEKRRNGDFEGSVKGSKDLKEVSCVSGNGNFTVGRERASELCLCRQSDGLTA